MKQYELQQTNDGLLKLRKTGTLKFAEETTFNNVPQIASDIFEVMHPEKFAEERVYVFALNARLQPLGGFEIARGGIDSCTTDIGMIFKRLLLLNSRGFLMFHNHPSGSPNPSREDDALTERAKEAGKILGIVLVDHIITGEKTYYSYYEQGKMD